MKKIALIFLIVGIGLLLYPKYEDYVYQKDQEALLSQYQNLDLGDSLERQNSKVKAAANDELEVDGLLQIPKIELSMPILKGASNENLRQSVSTVFSDETAGEGNYSIAGHRSYTYGKHFNRLAEVHKDDYIHVTSDGIKYTYKVNDTFRVKPTNVEVLNLPNKEDKAEITLITCSPMKNPTHRLIVKGKLVHQTNLTAN